MLTQIKGRQTRARRWQRHDIRGTRVFGRQRSADSRYPENLDQFLHQLLQVLLVGFAIGMMRTVVPALAEAEFGVAAGSFVLLTAFVVAFGIVKGVLNFVAGRLSERIGASMC